LRAVVDLDRKLAHVLEPGMHGPLVREWLLGAEPELARAVLSHVLSRPPPSDSVFDPLREALVELIAESDPEAGDELPYAVRRSLYELAMRRSDEALACLLRSAPSCTDFAEATSRLPKDVAEIPLGQRRSLAKGEDRHLLEKLALDPDPIVISNLLRNPRLCEQEVVRIAALRPVAASTLREIARSPRWAHQPRVRVALARNPVCPVELAVKLIGTIPLSDLRVMSSDPDLPAATLSQVRAELKRRRIRVKTPRFE